MTSLDSTLAFFGPAVDPASGEIKFGIGPAGNPMLVREHAGRYVLANGYHRALSLRRRGVETAPVALKHVDKAEMVDARSWCADLLFGDCPPLVDDFMDDALSTTVEVRSMLRVVRITAEVLVLPRLP